MPFSWNDSLVENMKSMRYAGYSATDIAGVLVDTEGFMTTRNGVLGKLFRLGLCTKREHVPASAYHPRRRRAEMDTTERPAKRRNHRGHIVTPPLPPEVIFEVLPEPEPPKVDSVPLMELSAEGCRWPMGDGSPQLFCNASATDGSYCRHHHRMGYRKPLSVSEKERRRRHYQSLKNISKLESGYAQSGVIKYVIDEEAA